MKIVNTSFFQWTLGMILVFLSAPISAVHAQSCPLPPPNSVWITDVTSNSVTAAWTPVSGASLYRMTVINLNTNLLIAEGYTIGTSKNLTGLPASTPIRVDIQASACDVDQPAYFGGAASAITQTLGYIVGDLVLGRCTPDGSGSIPTGTISVELPHNQVGAATLDYYQAKVEGRVGCKKGCDDPTWRCIFNIVVPCATTFFVDMDEEGEGGSYGVTIVQPAPEKVMFVHTETGQLLFTFSDPVSVNNVHQHFTNINFEGTTEITFFSSNAGGSCNMLDPGGLCASGGETRSSGGQASLPGHAASLAPNPATDRVDLQFHLAAASEVDVNLYDPAGRLVQQAAQQTAMPEGQNRLALDVSALPPGFYFVQLRSAQGMETMTLVKQ